MEGLNSKIDIFTIARITRATFLRTWFLKTGIHTGNGLFSVGKIPFLNFSLQNSLLLSSLAFFAYYCIHHDCGTFEERVCVDKPPHSLWTQNTITAITYNSGNIFFKRLAETAALKQ